MLKRKYRFFLQNVRHIYEVDESVRNKDGRKECVRNTGAVIQIVYVECSKNVDLILLSDKLCNCKQILKFI